MILSPELVLDFCEKVLTLPDGSPRRWLPFQRQILMIALAVSTMGRPIFPEGLYSTNKRSGKTTAGSDLGTAYGFLEPNPGEVFFMSSDLDGAKNKGFQKCKGNIERSPALMAETRKIASTWIELKNGTVIRAVPMDAGGIAGSDMIFCHVDELWSFDQEALARMWDETTPIASRDFSMRFSTSYAGFTGQSTVLERIWQLGLEGKQVIADLPVYANEEAGLLAYIDQGVEARRFPWQQGEVGEKYYRAQAKTLRPSAYRRLHLNQWSAGEEALLSMDLWDAATDPAHRSPLPDKDVHLFVGLDLGLKHDASAVVSVYRDGDVLKLGPRRTWRPKKGEPLQLERVADYLRELHRGFTLRQVLYDPWQGASLAQRLTGEGLRMVEQPMSQAGLTEATETLLDVVKGKTLVLYEDAELRSEAAQAQAKEHARGVQITKAARAHRIDSIVALALGVLGAVRAGHRVGDRGEPAFFSRSAEALDRWAKRQDRRRAAWDL